MTLLSISESPESRTANYACIGGHQAHLAAPKAVQSSLRNWCISSLEYLQAAHVERKTHQAPFALNFS